jgi:hypothetical protein
MLTPDWLRAQCAEDPTTGCWEWQRGRNRDGYGRIFRGRKKGQSALAHRVMFELVSNRALTAESLVCHHCDNPPCCNPEHLYLGTPKQNVGDMLLRGRHVAANRKLTESDVLELVETIRRGGVTTREVAARYNVTPATIRDIFRGARWRKVDLNGARLTGISPIKLTTSDVRAIKSLRDSGRTAVSVAADFGVSSRMIGMIWQGRARVNG